jgi:hypothetical protein
LSQQAYDTYSKQKVKVCLNLLGLLFVSWWFRAVVLNPNYSATRFLSTTYNFWTLDSKKQSLETNSTFLSSPILSTQEI